MMENKKVPSKVSYNLSLANTNQQVLKPGHHSGGMNLLGD